MFALLTIFSIHTDEHPWLDIVSGKSEEFVYSCVSGINAFQMKALPQFYQAFLCFLLLLFIALHWKEVGFNQLFPENGLFCRYLLYDAIMEIGIWRPGDCLLARYDVIVLKQRVFCDVISKSRRKEGYDVLVSCEYTTCTISTIWYTWCNMGDNII